MSVFSLLGLGFSATATSGARICGSNTRIPWSQGIPWWMIWCTSWFRVSILGRFSTSWCLSRLFCRDVVFVGLGNSHFGSCVLDLLQFVFTSIDSDIRLIILISLMGLENRFELFRSNFLADFVCSVYYDSFIKAVGNINKVNGWP